MTRLTFTRFWFSRVWLSCDYKYKYQIYSGCVYNSLWTRPQTNSHYIENISDTFTKKIVLIGFFEKKRRKKPNPRFHQKKNWLWGEKAKIKLLCKLFKVFFSFLRTNFSLKKTNQTNLLKIKIGVAYTIISMWVSLFWSSSPPIWLITVGSHTRKYTNLYNVTVFVSFVYTKSYTNLHTFVNFYTCLT